MFLLLLFVSLHEDISVIAQCICSTLWQIIKHCSFILPFLYAVYGTPKKVYYYYYYEREREREREREKERERARERERANGIHTVYTYLTHNLFNDVV